MPQWGWKSHGDDGDVGAEDIGIGITGPGGNDGEHTGTGDFGRERTATDDFGREIAGLGDLDGAEKVLIVEGQTDKERIEQILTEPISIVCTRGTLSYERIEEEIVPLTDSEVYILVDADDPGMKLRNQLRQELPNAAHLYTKRMYREVATTPMSVLAHVLQNAHFEIDEKWLVDSEGKDASTSRSRKTGLHPQLPDTD